MTGEPASVIAMRQLAEEAHRRPYGRGAAVGRLAADRRQQRAGERPADEPPRGR